MTTKYVVVQRTGFVPYFLSLWSDGPNGKDSWDYVRARALVFDGPVARQIASQLNARNPAAVVLVSIEVIR